LYMVTGVTMLQNILAITPLQRPQVQ
jgi:hypothetical protein